MPMLRRGALLGWIFCAAALAPAHGASAADPVREARAAYLAAQGDAGRLQEALALANDAVRQAPGDTAALLLRADIRAALHEYPQALADYRQVPDAHLPAPRKMMQCLLRERVQPAPPPLDCYADAGRRYAAGQARPAGDPNYVMTQLLAEAPEADGLADALLAATPPGPEREIRAMLFKDFDRARYLRAVLP
ncbi:hypothetical protein [Bordetella petrii]|uniref:hypothetical protein n=1 Tax=Bordetella petrii TaxID=94624 RepID=UPI0038B25AB8